MWLIGEHSYKVITKKNNVSEHPFYYRVTQKLASLAIQQFEIVTSDK
jgi:hypothetical protein